jgi:hypothetical protein
VGDAAGFELLDQRIQGFFILPVADKTALLIYANSTAALSKLGLLYK